MNRRVELDDGKYTVVIGSDGSLYATRYGEPWRDLTGDKLVLAMAHEIEELRQVVPADGSVLQRADAWDAVWQQLNGLGAIDTATRGKTGKELATDAIKTLRDQTLAMDGLIELAQGWLNHARRGVPRDSAEGDQLALSVYEDCAGELFKALGVQVKRNCPPPPGVFTDEDDAAAQAERA